MNATYVGPGNDISSVQIQPRLITVIAGQAQPVTCAGSPGAQTLFPFVLSSANPAVAAVDNGSVNPSSVRGVAVGTTSLTCTRDFGQPVSDAVDVVVVAPVASVAVTPNPGSVAVGSTLQMAATTRDAANNVLTGRTVTWATSNAAVATVGPATGVVTGVAAGSVTITATSEGRTGTAAVTVASTGGISATVVDATTGSPMSGVLLEVRSGSGVTSGATAAPSVTTGSAGTDLFTGLPPGAYTVRASAANYADATSTATVIAGQNVPAQLAMSRGIVAGRIRATLTWTDGTHDLDLRLTLPTGEVVFWNNHSSDPIDGNGCIVTNPPYACLENDAQGGTDVSESVLISQMMQGTYTLSVYNYTADWVNKTPGDATLAASGARVSVYFGTNTTASYTFSVPNLPGDMWTVFTLTGSTPQSLTPSNAMSTVQIVSGFVREGTTSRATVKLRSPPMP